MTAGQSHEFREIHQVSQLEPFDDAVAPALRFQRRNDAGFHHRANLPISRVAIDFGDAFILAGGEGLAVTVGVGQEPPLAKVDLSRRELVEPAQGGFVINGRIAQRDDEEESFDGKFWRVQPVVLHLLKNSWYAFPHFLEITEIGERSYNQWIARKVDVFVVTQVFERYRRRQKSGTTHLNAIIEHPNFDGRTGDSIIPIRHGVY